MHEVLFFCLYVVFSDDEDVDDDYYYNDYGVFHNSTLNHDCAA